MQALLFIFTMCLPRNETQVASNLFAFVLIGLHQLDTLLSFSTFHTHLAALEKKFSVLIRISRT